MVTQVTPGHDVDAIKEAFEKHMIPLLEPLDAVKFGAQGGNGQWTLSIFIETDMTVTLVNAKRDDEDD